MKMFKKLSFFVLVLCMQNMVAVLPAAHPQDEMPTIWNQNRSFHAWQQQRIARRERERAAAAEHARAEHARQNAAEGAIAAVSTQGPAAPQQR